MWGQGLDHMGTSWYHVTVANWFILHASSFCGFLLVRSCRYIPTCSLNPIQWGYIASYAGLLPVTSSFQHSALPECQLKICRSDGVFQQLQGALLQSQTTDKHSIATEQLTSDSLCDIFSGSKNCPTFFLRMWSENAWVQGWGVYTYMLLCNHICNAPFELPQANCVM